MKLGNKELQTLLALDDDQDDWLIDDGIEYNPIEEFFGGNDNDSPEYLSDFDVSVDGHPMAEWDGPMGRYWVTYDSEADRDLAVSFNAAEWDHYHREKCEYIDRVYRDVCNLEA